MVCSTGEVQFSGSDFPELSQSTRGTEVRVILGPVLDMEKFGAEDEGRVHLGRRPGFESEVQWHLNMHDGCTTMYDKDDGLSLPYGREEVAY